MRIRNDVILAAALALGAGAAARPLAAQGAGGAGAGAGAGEAPDAATIVARGNGRGAPACESCHGPRLQGLPAMLSPRLAGQSAPYIVAQLHAFASGARKNAIMQPVAAALSPAEREALARYVTGLAPAAPAESATAPASPAVLALGRRLATRGDWTAGVPSCDRCHGPGGIGVGTAFPPLAGQSAAYLTNQLEAWKLQTRPPGPLGLMGAIAARLSDAQIAAVAAYYPTLPVAPSALLGGKP